jgi:hypothetical protein
MNSETQLVEFKESGTAQMAFGVQESAGRVFGHSKICGTDVTDGTNLNLDAIVHKVPLPKAMSSMVQNAKGPQHTHPAHKGM